MAVDPNNGPNNDPNNNPNNVSPSSTTNLHRFGVDDKFPDYIEEIEKKYKNDCKLILDASKAKDLIKLIAIGKKNNIPLLTYLFDAYTRKRIEIYNNKKDYLSVEAWLNTIPTPILVAYLIDNGMKKTEIRTALNTFTSRFNSKIHFHHRQKINDDIDSFALYADHIIKFIHNLMKTQQVHPPFQVDLCIIPNDITYDDDDDSGDDDDDDDYDDDDDDDVKTAHPGPATAPVPVVDDQDNLNDIVGVNNQVNAKNASVSAAVPPVPVDANNQANKPNAVNNQVNKPNSDDIKVNDDHIDIPSVLEEEYITQTIDHNSDQNRPALFTKMYKEFIKKDVIKNISGTGSGSGSGSTQYPKNSRLCIIVDRQNNKNAQDQAVKDFNDDIYMYRPNQGGNINDDHLAQIFLQNSCQYMFGGKNNSDVINAQTGDPKVFILSFHVEALDEIRCYLYWRSTMARFFPQDITDVLQYMFEVDKDEFCNKEFIKQQSANNSNCDDYFIAEMQDYWVDKQFGKFTQ